MLDVQQKRQFAAMVIGFGLLAILAMLAVVPVAADCGRQRGDVAFSAPGDAGDVPAIKIFRRRSCSGGRCG